MERRKVRRSKIWKLSKAEFQKLFDENHSYKEIIMNIFSSYSSGNYITLHERIKEESVNLDQFDINCKLHKERHMKNMVALYKHPSETMFHDNSKIDRRSIRLRIIADKLIPYICRDCGVTDIYNEKPIVLQLEHMNGVSNDHRLENLCFLCPNCHSQTKTWGGKNKMKRRNYETPSPLKKYERVLKFTVSKEELQQLLLKFPVITVGRQFGVSDNSIRKRARLLGIDMKIYNFRNKNWSRGQDSNLRGA